jgi:phosphoribosylformimino-5-aminoimidazole carboxamide ribotide isomerase
VIPWVALDVLGGRAVRLTRGRAEESVDYGDAGETLRKWVRRGVQNLHLVDLGAALGRGPSLEPLLAAAAGMGAFIQVGGGIRSASGALRLLRAGAARVVVGSLLFSNPAEAAALVSACGPGRCVVALDVLRGTVRASGWTRDTRLDLAAAFRVARAAGFQEALVTDIGRDGTLSGLDVGLFEELKGLGLPVIASGGVAREEEVRRLRGMPWVSGVVAGKALYEGRMALEAFLEAAS